MIALRKAAIPSRNRADHETCAQIAANEKGQQELAHGGEFGSMSCWTIENVRQR